jgi:putative ABC transport system permease protein
MRFLDLIRIILDNLARRKGRVLLTAIGVVIGTAAVIVLVSFGIGLQENATSQLGGIADLTRIDVSPQYNYEEMNVSKGGGGGTGPGGQPEFTSITPDVLAQFQAIPGVETVIARDFFNWSFVVQYGRLQMWAQITGLNTNDFSPLKYDLQSGSTTTLERGTAVVGYYLSAGAYDPKWRPGQPTPEPPQLQDQEVRLDLMKWTTDGKEIHKIVRLKVVGVMIQKNGEQDGMMLVNMEDLTSWNEWASGKKINRNIDGYPSVVVKAANADDVIEITQTINDMGFSAYNSQEYVKGITGFFTVMQIIFGGVGAIALLVAAIGIANTMTMAILERTREIGLIKALGGTNRDVLSIFRGEAAGIGFLGGLGGVLIGWGGGQILNIVAMSYLSQQAIDQGGMPPSVAVSTPLWLPIFALIFATLVGLISGLYPALRAATLIPVNALKYE